jgi:hypothetical protein
VKVMVISEGRGRSRWFNRQNLENLYHGDDVRKGNGQRTLRSVSQVEVREELKETAGVSVDKSVQSQYNCKTPEPVPVYSKCLSLEPVSSKCFSVESKSFP